MKFSHGLSPSNKNTLFPKKQKEQNEDRQYNSNDLVWWYKLADRHLIFMFFCQTFQNFSNHLIFQPNCLEVFFLQLMVRCPGLEKKPSMIIVGDMGRKTNVSFGSIH